MNDLRGWFYMCLIHRSHDNTNGLTLASFNINAHLPRNGGAIVRNYNLRKVELYRNGLMENHVIYCLEVERCL